MSTRVTFRGHVTRLPGAASTEIEISDPATRPVVEGELTAVIVGAPRFQGSLLPIQTGHGSGAALVAGFRAMRERVLDEIDGAFALAVIDAKAGSALLAVDRLGIEPLCVGERHGTLHFASLATQVFPIDADAGQLDRQALFDYLFFHMIPSPRTVFEGVTRLPLGHCARFESGHLSIEPYWRVRYRSAPKKPLELLKRQFRDSVDAAVADAVSSAQHPGAFLSGGTDSSTIAGVLTKVTGKPARTYSIGFDAAGFDEMSYARIASRHFGTDHHEYYITPDDLVESIPKIAAAYDQPFGNSSALPTYYCAKMARADGVDVMLGGDGGDELFGGNTRYAKQRVFSYYEALPPAARGVLAATLGPAMMGRIPLVKKARSYVEQARVPMPDRLQTYNQLMRLGYANVLTPAFLSGVQTDAPMQAMRAWYEAGSDAALIDRMLAFDLKYTLADNDLPKVVVTCALAGVRAAFPFLDSRIVAFSETLAPQYKLKGLKLRWFFKEALRGFLPEAILTKSKHGFGLPFGIWLTRHRGLADLAFSSLESLKQRDIVRPEFIDSLRKDLLAQHASYYGEMVWVLMMLEQWMRSRTEATRSRDTGNSASHGVAHPRFDRASTTAASSAAIAGITSTRS